MLYTALDYVCTVNPFTHQTRKHHVCTHFAVESITKSNIGNISNISNISNITIHKHHNHHQNISFPLFVIRDSPHHTLQVVTSGTARCQVPGARGTRETRNSGVSALRKPLALFSPSSHHLPIYTIPPTFKHNTNFQLIYLHCLNNYRSTDILTHLKP